MCQFNLMNDDLHPDDPDPANPVSVRETINLSKNMNTEIEIKKLQAIANLLAAMAEDWHDINFHSEASSLQKCAEDIERITSRISQV